MWIKPGRHRQVLNEVESSKWKGEDSQTYLELSKICETVSALASIQLTSAMVERTAQGEREKVLFEANLLLFATAT